MAKKATDWKRVNAQNVAIGNRLVKALSEMVATVGNQALHIQEQAEKIRRLEQQLATKEAQ